MLTKNIGGPVTKSEIDFKSDPKEILTWSQQYLLIIPIVCHVSLLRHFVKIYI